MVAPITPRTRHRAAREARINALLKGEDPYTDAEHREALARLLADAKRDQEADK